MQYETELYAAHLKWLILCKELQKIKTLKK